MMPFVKCIRCGEQHCTGKPEVWKANGSMCRECELYAKTISQVIEELQKLPPNAYLYHENKDYEMGDSRLPPVIKKINDNLYTIEPWEI